MERIIRVLNEMKSDRVILDYAIGGAVAVSFYTEPVETSDVDIFVVLPETSSPIITLTGVFDYLGKRGHRPSGEHVSIHGVLVQFLSTDPLTQEALENAVQKSIGSEPTRVLRAEYLLAIMVKLLRPKDRIRISMLLEQASLDKGLLDGIIGRHGLTERWQDFKKRFYG